MAAILILGGISLFILLFAVASALAGYWISSVVMLAVIALIWWLWACYG